MDAHMFGNSTQVLFQVPTIYVYTWKCHDHHHRHVSFIWPCM